MTTPCLTLPNDRTEAEVRAHRRGWRLADDGWWTRPYRDGDANITDSCVGYLIRPDEAKAQGEGCGPYVRSAEQAILYDAVPRGETI